MHCGDQRHLGLCLGYDPALAYGSCRVSDQGTTLRASDLHNARATILNPFNNAFIASNFNYCNTVWHFCSNRSLYKLDKVHKQALGVILNDYSSSYRNLLDKVSKPTLYVSRLKAIAIEVYKGKANENPDYINVMLNPLIKPYNLRGGPHAEQPKVNTTSCGLNSFTYQVAKLWNEIPSSIKDANSLLHFKSLLSKWAGPECHCGSCILCKVYDV